MWDKRTREQRMRSEKTVLKDQLIEVMVCSFIGLSIGIYIGLQL